MSIEIPRIICAPMAGGPTTPALVSAVGRAGGLGMLAGGYLTAAQLEPLVADVASAGVSFGVNLFLPGPNRLAADDADEVGAQLAAYARRLGEGAGEPDYFDEDIDAKIDMLARYRPALVSTTFADPGRELVDRIHDRIGASVAATVTSVDEAWAAASSGVDVLVAQGIEAGGHRGIWLDDPSVADGGAGTPTRELVARLAATSDLPIVAAGGVCDGASIAAVIAAGAVAAQLGTAFLCAAEAGTSALHRAALLDATRRADTAGSGTVVTRAFSGRPARSLRNRFGSENRDAPAVYPQVHYMTKPVRAAATAAGDAESVNLWAGTGWRAVRAEPAAAIVARLQPERTPDDWVNLRP